MSNKSQKTFAMIALVVLLLVIPSSSLELYGCYLSDFNPTEQEIIDFQACVGRANGVDSAEGGRWGRSVRSSGSSSVNHESLILYGCYLPDENPTEQEMIDFQACVAEANNVESAEGGRWGRSVRRAKSNVYRHNGMIYNKLGRNKAEDISGSDESVSMSELLQAIGYYKVHPMLVSTENHRQGFKSWFSINIVYQLSL